MHDGIALEARGLPTATICTAQFAQGAATMAAICGMPDYRVVYVGHPLANLTPAEAHQRAEAALDAVVRVLTGAGEVTG